MDISQYECLKLRDARDQLRKKAEEADRYVKWAAEAIEEAQQAVERAKKEAQEAVERHIRAKQAKIQADVAAAGAAEEFDRFAESRPDAERIADRAIAAEKRREDEWEKANQEILRLLDQRAFLASSVKESNCCDEGFYDYLQYDGDVLQCSGCEDGGDNDGVSWFCSVCRHARAKQTLRDFDRRHPRLLALERERANRQAIIDESKRFTETMYEMEMLVNKRVSELGHAQRAVL